MSLFDAPTRETCAVVRNATNTPLQALVVMNEPQFVESGIALGNRMIQEGGATPSVPKADRAARSSLAAMTAQTLMHLKENCIHEFGA